MRFVSFCPPLNRLVIECVSNSANLYIVMVMSLSVSSESMLKEGRRAKLHQVSIKTTFLARVEVLGMPQQSMAIKSGAMVF